MSCMHISCIEFQFSYPKLIFNFFQCAYVGGMMFIAEILGLVKVLIIFLRAL